MSLVDPLDHADLIIHLQPHGGVDSSAAVGDGESATDRRGTGEGSSERRTDDGSGNEGPACGQQAAGSR